MNKKVKFLGDIEVNSSLTLGETTLTETELKALKSATTVIEDITYVGTGESITFGNENTLSNGFITKIGGNSSKYGDVEKDLIDVNNYKKDDAVEMWDANGNIILPGLGVNIGFVLLDSYITLVNEGTFISFSSDQEPLDGFYPEYQIETDDGSYIVEAGQTRVFQAGTVITRISISCYTDMVTWNLNKPKFVTLESKDLTSIKKEGVTNIITLEDGIGSIVPQYNGSLTKTSTSIGFSGYGLAAEFNGDYTMIDNKIMEEDGEIYIIENYYSIPPSRGILFMKNGSSCEYSSELIDESGFGDYIFKYGIPVVAGDSISIILSVSGSVCGYDGLVNYEVYTNLGAEVFTLPEIPKLSLGIDNRYYNYIDFENNFAGILVDVVEFDGSEDEEWEFYDSSTGDYNVARNQKFVKPIKYNSVSQSYYDELIIPITGGEPFDNAFSFAEGYLQIGAPLTFQFITEEEWRAWLSQHPFKLIYVLPPEERQIIPLDEIEPLAITLGASNTLTFANCPAVCTVKYQEKG